MARFVPLVQHQRICRAGTTNKDFKGCLGASSQDPADLLDVIGIVARHMGDQIPDRNTATLGMDTKAFPLFWRDLHTEQRLRFASTWAGDMLPGMANAEQVATSRAKLRNSTTVFLVGNIEPTMEWYKQLGFESEYYPPGFAILPP